METFVFGFLGASVMITLLALGVFIGWRAHDAVQKLQKPEAEPLTPDQKRIAEQHEEAVRFMDSYDAAAAYGLRRIKKEEGEDE